MKITNNATMYLKVMGHLFKIEKVCKSVEEANKFCATNPNMGVLSESPEDGLVYIAALDDLGIPA